MARIFVNEIFTQRLECNKCFPVNFNKVYLKCLSFCFASVILFLGFSLYS